MILSDADDGTVRLWDVADAFAASSYPRQLILGPGPNTCLELASDGADGYRVAHASADAWRYFGAQGHAPDGSLVTAPIEEMMDWRSAASSRR